MINRNLAVLFLILCAACTPPPYTLQISKSNLLSHCHADVTGDGDLDLIVLTRADTKTPHGTAGDFLYVLTPDDELFARHKVLHRFDLTKAKPLKVMAGDVNRDGLNEISVKVYKTAEFHTEYAQRPFFFSISNGALAPVWLGSRLARPFMDYVLVDLDTDGFCEIVSLEDARDGWQLSAYRWDSFGFVCFVRGESIKDPEGLEVRGDRVAVRAAGIEKIFRLDDQENFVQE